MTNCFGVILFRGESFDCLFHLNGDVLCTTEKVISFFHRFMKKRSDNLYCHLLYLRTCFTQHSSPFCGTSAGFNSCTSATILTRARAGSCNRVIGVTMTSYIVHWISTAYICTVAHSLSTVHQTGRFYCLILAVCSLHHRRRSLQSCRLYWGNGVDHLWEYQDHRS